MPSVDALEHSKVMTLVTLAGANVGTGQRVARLCCGVGGAEVPPEGKGSRATSPTKASCPCKARASTINEGMKIWNSDFFKK